jgi:hypothetical protein
MAQELDQKIDRLLLGPPYAEPPEAKHAILIEIFKDELDYACERLPEYRRYVRRWPIDFRSATRLADLPYLPVGALKADPPLSLVEPAQIKRTLTSSATTSQVPSRVVLDAPTAQRMSKGLAAIIQDFIGSARRPYLVVDTPGATASGRELGARGAAIQGLQPFAKETVHCLAPDERGEPVLQWDRLREFAERQAGAEVLVYGFTYILWERLVKPALAEGFCLNLPKAFVLHSGGWKKLQEQAVEKSLFNRQLAAVIGCSPDRIIDFYGMVENVGVVYPDCIEGNKHAPLFAEVIVRDPLTLKPAEAGGRGLIQVCSALPTSFPGHLLLTEDMAEVIGYDGCPCGRRGISFRFAGRVPKAEARGCGNLSNKRAAAIPPQL